MSIWPRRLARTTPSLAYVPFAIVLEGTPKTGCPGRYTSDLTLSMTSQVHYYVILQDSPREYMRLYRIKIIPSTTFFFSNHITSILEHKGNGIF